MVVKEGVKVGYKKLIVNALILGVGISILSVPLSSTEAKSTHKSKTYLVYKTNDSKVRKYGLNKDIKHKVLFPYITKSEFKNSAKKQAQSTLDYNINYKMNSKLKDFYISKLIFDTALNGKLSYKVNTSVSKVSKSKKFVSYKTEVTLNSYSKGKKIGTVISDNKYTNLNRNNGKSYTVLNTALKTPISHNKVLDSVGSNVSKKLKLNKSESKEMKNQIKDLKSLNGLWYFDSKNNIVVRVNFTYATSKNTRLSSGTYTYNIPSSKVKKSFK